ncbi:MAG TPA: hypothetical protein VJP41_11120 [Gaiellaceae bacterium]|nr:hypothetical protein [Gaiellaceae bacterium]
MRGEKIQQSWLPTRRAAADRKSARTTPTTTPPSPPDAAASHCMRRVLKWNHIVGSPGLRLRSRLKRAVRNLTPVDAVSNKWMPSEKRDPLAAYLERYSTVPIAGSAVSTAALGHVHATRAAGGEPEP